MANEVRSGTTRKRKNPYVAGIAALNFKPDFDWEWDEARALFERTTFGFPADIVHFQDCCKNGDYLRHLTSIQCPIFYQY